MQRIIRILGLVLGLASPFPEVWLSEPSFHVEEGGLFVKVRASGVINDQLFSLIDAYVPVTVVTRVEVWVDDRLVRRFAVSQKVERVGEFYEVEGEGPLARERVEDVFSLFKVRVLEDVERYRGRKVRVRISLALYSSVFSPVQDLWGNNPVTEGEWVVPEGGDDGGD